MATTAKNSGLDRDCSRRVFKLRLGTAMLVLNPLRFDPSSATVRRVLFTSILLFDVLFVVDAGMRWHVSFAFAGKAWVKDVAIVLVPQLLLAWVLLRRQAPSGLAAAVMFPLLATAFMAASKGSPFIDWWNAPFLSFTIGPDWHTKLVNRDGNFTALVGAVFHFVAQYTCKRASRTLPNRAGALLLIGLGAAWMIAVPMVLADPIIYNLDPREPSADLIAQIAFVRAVLWCTLAGIGAVLVVTGFAVLSFRQEP
ncbi:MAG TPA: hypothetical protein VEX18_01110 [Polyangiaceae bacterium]|nr:hypothetical protein [Polyangiaceae bacterium]